MEKIFKSIVKQTKTFYILKLKIPVIFFFKEKGYLFKWGKEIFSEKRDLFCIVVKVSLRINIKDNSFNILYKNKETV